MMRFFENRAGLILDRVLFPLQHVQFYSTFSVACSFLSVETFQIIGFVTIKWNYTNERIIKTK